MRLPTPEPGPISTISEESRPVFWSLKSHICSAIKLMDAENLEISPKKTSSRFAIGVSHESASWKLF